MHAEAMHGLAEEWLEHARRETEEVAEKLRKKYEKARHQGAVHKVLGKILHLLYIHQGILVVFHPPNSGGFMIRCIHYSLSCFSSVQLLLLGSQLSQP